MRHSGTRSLALVLLLGVLAAMLGGLGTKDTRDRGPAGGTGGSGDSYELESDEGELRSPNGRVINGKQVDDATFRTRYPSVVALQDARRGTTQYAQFGCGGTLVAPTKVLTAAHCMDGVPVASLKVLAGSASLDQTSRAVTQLVAAKSVVVHPSWNRLDVSKGNDLAVITLAAPMATTATVAPAAVVGPGEDNIWGAGRGVTQAPERGPWLVGWGNTVAGGGPVNMPRIANDTNAQILPDTSCSQFYWGPTFRADLNICTGGERTDDPAGSSACNGDSGSPLLASANGAWRVVGVASYGAKPCDGKQPTVYVKVAAFRAWLQQQGVPVGTGTVPDALPAPAVTGRGNVLPPGEPITIETPEEGVTLNGFEAALDMRWALRADQRAGDLVVRRDGAEVLRQAMGGYIGYRLPVGRYQQGSYQWCIASVDQTNGAPGGEQCRAFARSAEHKATLTSIRVRGRRGSFAGQVLSTEPTVKVAVQVKVGRKVLTRKSLTVKTRGPGVVSPFSWSANVPRGARLRAVTARVVVDGGGAKRGFTNVLR